jgi:hypothetical protein
VLKLLLDGDFLVHQHLHDWIATVVVDDLEGVLAALGVRHSPDSSGSPFSDQAQNFVGDTIDLDLWIRQHRKYYILGMLVQS